MTFLARLLAAALALPPPYYLPGHEPETAAARSARIEVIVSAAPGFEFADLAGRHHSGGGSHGSLRRGDSEVPMLTIGIDAQPQSIVEVAPAVLQHFGVTPPAYARTLTRAA